MITLASFLCLFIGFGLLSILAVIDLKIRLLPDIYVFPFALTGIVFHNITQFTHANSTDIIIGCALGAGFLYTIRAIANRAYKTDTLGLGDVKLMGAAGIWLGTDHIFLALSIGAMAGVIHGLIYARILHIKSGEKINLNTLKIPAGPGFIIGILIAATLKFEHALYTPPH